MKDDEAIRAANKMAQLLLKKHAETPKQRMMNSFNNINMCLFIELERIKKP